MSQRVFISRNEDECQELSKTMEAEGIELYAISMLQIVAWKFHQPIPQTDWIFFSSRNAVRHFFGQSPKLNNQRLAAVGRGTANELTKYGKVSFVGTYIDTRLTALEFKELVSDATILFPQSQISRKTIESVFDRAHTVPLVCYQTTMNPQTIPSSSAYVFSSPSNVHAFFKKNKLSADAKVMAFGYPTRDALVQHGMKAVSIPTSLDVEGLCEAIKHLLKS